MAPRLRGSWTTNAIQQCLLGLDTEISAQDRRAYSELLEEVAMVTAYKITDSVRGGYM